MYASRRVVNVWDLKHVAREEVLGTRDSEDNILGFLHVYVLCAY